MVLFYTEGGESIGEGNMNQRKVIPNKKGGKVKMKNLLTVIKKLLVCVLAVCFFIATPVQAALAAENDGVAMLEKATNLSQDEPLSKQESIKKFIKDHPEYKQEVMNILRDKGALNSDNTIKEDLGQMATSSKAATIYTGYMYTLAGTMNVDEFYLKTLVAGLSNSSYQAIPFTLNQSYTTTVMVSSTFNIGSSVELEKVFKLQAGVSFTYSLTQAASTVYGMNPIVPARTYARISANPYSTCYSYHEQYYVLGVPVGDQKTLGVFKPTGVHWYYEETKM